MKIVFFVLNLFLIFGLVGCKEDPIQKDLVDYINNSLKQISELETDAINAYSANTGENYKNDETLLFALDGTVIPKYQKLFEESKKIAINSAEVKDINKTYSKATEGRLDALKSISSGIKEKDKNKVTDGNKKLSQMNKEIDDWKGKLDELCKKHNVKLL